jgi:hypothetical protein
LGSAPSGDHAQDGADEPLRLDRLVEPRTAAQILGKEVLVA